MQCRYCGEFIDTRDRQVDGSVICPGCGTVYKPKKKVEQNQVERDVSSRRPAHASSKHGSSSRQNQRQVSARSGKERRRASSHLTAKTVVGLLSAIIVIVGASFFIIGNMNKKGLIKATTTVNDTAMENEAVPVHNSSADISTSTVDVHSENNEDVDSRTEWEKLFEDGPLRAGSKFNYDGYIDINGDWIFDPETTSFDELGPFYEGLASVRVFDENIQEYRYGYINAQGEFAIPPRFSRAQSFNNGIAIVCENGLYGYIDRNGDYLIAPRFESAGRFYNELAIVKEGGLFGYIDLQGNYVIQPTYSEAYPFREGLAVVKESSAYGPGGCGYIDMSGKRVIDFSYGMASSFSNGRAFVTYALEAADYTEWFMIDTNGQIIGKFKTSKIKSNGDTVYWYGDQTLLIVKDPVTENRIIVDINGNTVFSEPSGIHLDNFLTNVFSNLPLPARDNTTGKRGYIDLSGKWVIPPIYDGVNEFTSRKSDVGLKYAFLNDNGESKVAFVYNRYENGDVEYVIDTTGRVLFSSEGKGYHLIDVKTEGRLIPVYGEDEEHIGFIDANGNITVDFWFLDVKEIGADDSYAKVMSEDELWGYVDQYGNMLIWPNFTYIKR